MDKDSAPYTAKNSSVARGVESIYGTARIAPQSLKYYGLCLRQGNYKVQLHFDEIMYSDHETFESPRRRLFDVSIQGQVVLKDFNIAEEACGMGRNISKVFNATVHGSTLEIHLYRRGKVIGNSKSKQGNREFVNEIGMISALQHPNLVKLYGCCIEGNQLLLRYLENNSLARALFGLDEQRLTLDWSTRRKICMGIARGLAYLLEESILKIVHRDLKASNVLLDKNLIAKISDFGLAKLDEEENTHISTRIAGTV
ncbi:hypothetical protein DITRI_Ditri07aG0011200 [Diplodiscus trichospermus]